MSTGWQEEDGIARCDARDPQGRQCVLASGHAGDHEPEPESIAAVDVPEVGEVSIDPSIAAIEKSQSDFYRVDVPHDGTVHVDIKLGAADERELEEREEPHHRGGLRGCFGSAALLVAVFVAIALTQRRP